MEIQGEQEMMGEEENEQAMKEEAQDGQAEVTEGGEEEG
jgi:hypothetical protein